ncbi:MAG: hypothetical protein KBT41_00835 [bacterium]|nr:hypothetical protein [Candidatus Colousia faecequi]
MNRLYIFNPEHDMALAAWSANYQAPESTLFLASDLAMLPRWYAERGGVVFNRGDLTPFDGEGDRFEMVEPWGWDPAVRRLLIVNGVSENILPKDGKLEKIRDLSHRRIATKAMDFLRADLSGRWELPMAAEELHSVDEVRNYCERYGQTVLKAPWSSSGRGVYWTDANFTQSVSGWIKRVIDKQGSIMAEKALKRRMDFAMEFRVVDQKTEFVGYSLFITEKSGMYRGNRLMSNEDILAELGKKVDVEEIDAAKESLTRFIDGHIAHTYYGYIGVDMFIYEENGEMRLNPVVEINLRMTMGVVARILYDRYVAKGVKGLFMIEHKSPGRLYVHHQWQNAKEKMQYDSNGKMTEGYLSLCDVTPNTLYRASILLGDVAANYESKQYSDIMDK